jgi:hypothetical protein
MSDWHQQLEREASRYRDGESRLGDSEDDPRQRRLTRLGNAAWGAGLSALMLGRRDDAAAWLDRAAARYRESWDEAPPGSWGRPIAVLKVRLLAGVGVGASARTEDAARWALTTGCVEAESPIGRYAGTLALLVLGRDGEALPVARSLQGVDGFPPAVAAALAGLAAGDRAEAATAIEAVLVSFETRDSFLEDVPVADTVLCLHALAAARWPVAPLRESALLPSRASS